MRARWQKWTDERIGVELAGTPDELRRLAGALVELSRDREQHFHIRETGRGNTLVGDIEISVLDDGDESLAISSFALAPGTEIPDPPTVERLPTNQQRSLVRRFGYALVVAGLCWTLWNAFATGPLIRVQAAKDWHDLERETRSSFEKGDVYRWIRMSEGELIDRLPNAIWPALVLAAGSVLIDIASRRKRR